jgi:hypothetical protein
MTPEARAARERKQKIFVVVGGLLLVGLLAIQLPKLLGGSSTPEAVSSTETTATAQSMATPVALQEAATTAVATTAKLTSFTVFSRKDPFVQQVVTQNGLTASESAGAAASTEKSGEAGTAPTTTFSTGAKAAAVTIVTVNGARQMLEPGMKFPAGDPLFVLVAEKPGSKSVVVGIVGGAYADGDETTTLKVGKPLTLVNTTTGARYKISLVSVGRGEQAEQPALEP